MSPIQSAFPGIQIGSVNISYFGLLVVVALSASGLALRRLAPRLEDSTDIIVDIIVMSFLSAVIFGRLAYVLAPPPSVEVFYSREWYLSHFSDLLVGPLAIWSGGLDAGGLLLGALVGSRLVIWRRQLPYEEWASAVSVSMTIFLAVAPLANLVNSQQMGPATTLPWGLPIEHRFAPIDDLALYPTDTHFHPTPAYVSLWAIAVLLLLPRMTTWFGKNRDHKSLYLMRGMLLLPGLFAADFLRLDASRPLLGMTVLQCVTTVLWVILVIQATAKRQFTRSAVLNN